MDSSKEAVLDTPPHIPSGSEQNGRNPSRSEQIPSGMVGIRANSDPFRVKKFKLSFFAIPTHSESFRAESEHIPS